MNKKEWKALGASGLKAAKIVGSLTALNKLNTSDAVEDDEEEEVEPPPP